MSTEEMRLEYVPLKKLLRWPGNPKGHADADLDASFERFGYVTVIALFIDSIVAPTGRLSSKKASTGIIAQLPGLLA